MSYRNLPNQLTILRLLLAGGFFFMLNLFRYTPGHTEGWKLWTAMGVFIAAMLTDIADGYLARRWRVESTFGRIMDPFVDKVVVLGALIYLAGPRFVNPEAAGDFFNMTSGVYPWMVVVIFAREMLVTAIRGAVESEGAPFGAKWQGKLKTLFQSVGIPFILGIVALDPNAVGHVWMKWVREFFAYGMVIVTMFSGLPYVVGAMQRLGHKSTG